MSRDDKPQELPHHPAERRVERGTLPRLEGDLVIKMRPEEVTRVFAVVMDSDRDSAFEFVSEVLYRKIRRILERPHCMPVFEMNQKVSDKG